MNFDGFTPQAIPRFGSLVQSDDVTELPLGIAEDTQNCHYREQSVGPRDGVGIKLQFGVGNAIRGLGVLRYLAADTTAQENISIIACTKDGRVSSASPFVQASMMDLTAATIAAGLVLAPNLYPQLAQAYNKMLIAQGNLMIGKAPPLIVNGATMRCTHLSDKPVGDVWLPQTTYRTGHIVSPSGTGTNLFYCIQGGVSGTAEPLWANSEAVMVYDGPAPTNIVWRLLNLICTSGLRPPPPPLLSSAVAGTLVAPGATIFLTCTWTNQFGESTAKVVNRDGTIASVLKYTNSTGAAVNLNVILPPVPPDIAALAGQYGILSCNLYGFLTYGTPDPTLYLDPASYALLTSNAPGTLTALSTTPVGKHIPLTNTAFTTDTGNVASGVRYMIVLYKSDTGYITGFSGPAPIECDITVDGRKMLAQNIPIGPYNCAERICAFTVAGQGSAGPYFYIAADDFEDPGFGQAKIKQTATVIPDNVTTSAYFDFLDSYLPGASNVTTFFDRVEVPPCSDAYFSKSLNRVIYTGCVGFPSGYLVSDLEDAEAVRVPGSIVQASQTDGDRTVCWRESGTLQVAYKENSAHAVTPNDGDPQDWGVVELWHGSGPCGPRAIDVANADGEKLTAYAHITGGYVWDGGSAPTLLTKDLQGSAKTPGVWPRIHWAYAHLIKTTINLKERLIYYFVPLDGATRNTHRITLNFFRGLDDPIVFIQRTGKEVPNITGRKWSVDSIDGNDCVYVPQRLSAGS